MNQITLARLLAYVTGLGNQELLLQNEYLAAENRILKAHLQPGSSRLSDGEKATLAEIGKRLGRKALQQVAHVAKPDTILGWYRRLVAAKFDGSKQRRSPRRPRILSESQGRRVSIAGITDRPDACWMRQVARNATFEELGYLSGCRYVLHDRETKFCAEFRETLAAGGVKCLPLPARSPNLNAFAERWVRAIKEECLSKLILFGEASLRRALSQFQEHYHTERNHQGKGNVLLFPRSQELAKSGGSSIECRERLGLLKYYYRRAA